MTRDIWNSWCHDEITFEKKEMDSYRGIVEKINDELGKVGRAIGHRVWQSMEYYMANYPGTFDEDKNIRDNAMACAFQDQIVQKVMTKLRGIDDRGKGRECLDSIQRILDEKPCTQALVDDFQRARDLGYGQFIWNSAEYLQEDEDDIDEENDNA